MLRLVVNRSNSGATRAHTQFFKTQGEIVSIPVALVELRLVSA